MLQNHQALKRIIIAASATIVDFPSLHKQHGLWVSSSLAYLIYDGPPSPRSAEGARIWRVCSYTPVTRPRAGAG